MDNFPEFHRGLSRRAMRRHEDADRRGSRSGGGVVHVPGRQVPSPRPARGEGVQCVRRRRCGKRTAEMGHGTVSLSASPSPLPPSSPVLGYLGCIGRWFDWPLVVRLAEAMPQARIELVGPCAGAARTVCRRTCGCCPPASSRSGRPPGAVFGGLDSVPEQRADGRRRSDQVSTTIAPPGCRCLAPVSARWRCAAATTACIFSIEPAIWRRSFRRRSATAATRPRRADSDARTTGLRVFVRALVFDRLLPASRMRRAA